MHVRELGFPSPPLPLYPTSYPYTISTNIKRATQDIIPPSTLHTPILCLNTCPTLSAFPFCTQAVNLLHTLAWYMNFAPLIPPVLHCTKLLRVNLVPNFYATL